MLAVPKLKAAKYLTLLQLFATTTLSVILFKVVTDVFHLAKTEILKLPLVMMEEQLFPVLDLLRDSNLEAYFGRLLCSNKFHNFIYCFCFI